MGPALSLHSITFGSGSPPTAADFVNDQIWKPDRTRGMRSQRGLLSWRTRTDRQERNILNKKTFLEPLTTIFWRMFGEIAIFQVQLWNWLTWTNIYPLPDGTFASMIFLFIMDMVLFPGGLKVSRGQVGWFVFFSPAETHTAFFKFLLCWHVLPSTGVSLCLLQGFMSPRQKKQSELALMLTSSMFWSQWRSFKLLGTMIIWLSKFCKSWTPMFETLGRTAVFVWSM